MEEKKKGNKGLVVLVVILLLACIGMGAFIYINKDKVFSEESSSKINKNGELEDFDLSFDLNTKEYGLSANRVGIMVNVDTTREKATISYNGATLSNSFALGWVTAADTTTYEPLGTKTLNNRVTQVLIDGPGQTVNNMAILYLMADGTVEYVPILKELNTNWSQPDNTKKFNSYGKLNGLSDIISLIPAEAQGYHTVLARRADGAVINLNEIFKATGNFS